MATAPRLSFAVSQQAVPALINALLNGIIAWAMHRGPEPVALWGDGGYASDLIATGVLLPGLTWMILHPLLRHQARQGKAPGTAGVPTPWLSRWLPSGFWAGSAVVGLAGGAIGLLASALMHALGAPSMPGTGYAVFKAAYAGLLPVLLQPAMVFGILRGAPAAAATRAAA